MSLIEDFETVLNEDGATGEFSIESRSCANDSYSGVQYNFYGCFVSLRPIIEVIGDTEGKAIDHLFHVTEGEEPYIGVFVADIEEQSHPAFTL